MGEVVILFTKDEWESASEEDREYIARTIRDRYGYSISNLQKEDDENRKED